jgi:hypothetical protein
MSEKATQRLDSRAESDSRVGGFAERRQLNISASEPDLSDIPRDAGDLTIFSRSVTNSVSRSGLYRRPNDIATKLRAYGLS